MKTFAFSAKDLRFPIITLYYCIIILFDMMIGVYVCYSPRLMVKQMSAQILMTVPAAPVAGTRALAFRPDRSDDPPLFLTLRNFRI